MLGGGRHALGGLYFEPTILTEVADASETHHTEIFGPVFPTYSFKTEEEVTQRANDTE
jgi:succinate-semialdehyde dehydrogenase/glutarate-semialdehyde dehydrogenase